MFNVINCNCVNGKKNKILKRGYIDRNLIGEIIEIGNWKFEINTLITHKLLLDMINNKPKIKHHPHTNIFK